MEFLLENIGENKVTLEVNANDFEQRTDYMYSFSNKQFFADLLSKQKATSNEVQENVRPICGSFMKIMRVLKDPVFLTYGPQEQGTMIKEFIDSVSSHENTRFKKLTKHQQHDLSKRIEAGVIDSIDEYLLKFFSNVLDKSLFLVDERGLLAFHQLNKNIEGLGCIVMKHRDGLFSVEESMINNTVSNVKEFMIKNKFINSSFIDTLSAKEVQDLACRFEVALYKDTDGKKKKLLKEEMKKEIIKKI